jgi:geranylgeranyl pyrophosphate synthase
MATAVELLHIATLIHDDTVDNSPLRRGKATVSNRWGQKVAILLGDYVFATSATFVCDTKHVRVIRRFSETIMELSSGELLEYFHVSNWRLSRADYEDRIYRKTASLFRTAAESGALLSGVSEEVVQALADYGCNIGLAFQIIDDVLDVQGNAREIGKPVGNDLLQGVVTLPHIMLVERYPNDNPIQRLFDGDRDPASLQRVIEMIQNSDIVEQCYTTARNYCQKALAALKYVPEVPPKQSLEALVSYTMERKR